jgi:hypothetical protein
MSDPSARSTPEPYTTELLTELLNANRLVGWRLKLDARSTLLLQF